MKELFFGIDVGNSMVKGCSDSGDCLFSSSILPKEHEAESLFFKDKSDQLTFSSLKHSGEEYLWSQKTHYNSKAYDTNIGEGRYKNKYFRLLCEAIQAYMVLENVEDKDSDITYKVNLVVGIPTKQLGTHEQEDLKKTFEGRHVVAINNEEVVFDTTVFGVISQPLGTVLDKILDDEPELAEKYIGVIDIGGGTVDLDGINNLETVSEDRETFKNLGAYFVYREMADYINKIEPTVASATPASVEEQFHQDHYKISDHMIIPIHEAKKRILTERAASLTQKINIRWQSTAKFDKILITGGGSHLYKDYFYRDSFPRKKVHVVNDPQLANARGFYKYALFLAQHQEEQLQYTTGETDTLGE